MVCCGGGVGRCEVEVRYLQEEGELKEPRAYKVCRQPRDLSVFGGDPRLSICIVKDKRKK